MKIKTSDLSGKALDWAVAVAEGGHGLHYDTVATWWITIDGYDRALGKGWTQSFTPSTDWAQGGPIVERNWTDSVSILHARFGTDWPLFMHVKGCTTLVAFMRCYVASELGDEIDVPDGLL